MLDDLKQQVCQANLDLVAHGLVTLTWGNVSGLSPDHTVFAIKPSGVSYDDMRPEQMVLVSVETGETVDGDLKPSSDTATHRLLYQAFDGVGGVTHTHSRHAVMFAQARREIPCFGTTHADHFYGPVPCARALTEQEIEEAYEANTGQVIIERFKELGVDPVAVPGVLVASHAPFAWGKNAADSVKNAVALESVAEMALGTLQLSPDQSPVEQYLLDKHYFRKHGPDAYYGQKKG
ncbi:L-ribulose-5-phosphate 4-epimerase [Pseudobythopirellula maris]|uniref:L-ribulose-5-phosphate 4-epimerase n=1 Tax=Pseudobythopirellula maris TaxID=2527991 RepID=A0A5C5ZJV9_9BACT|nr:L-ribulose-5-phosphate 4-epimerase [Pseudobythopirellula maris]TWT87408.1 L-ribulose-5-phosphate 4-epimerase [Pseudobythopirellula maris]